MASGGRTDGQPCNAKKSCRPWSHFDQSLQLVLSDPRSADLQHLHSQCKLMVAAANGLQQALESEKCRSAQRGFWWMLSKRCPEKTELFEVWERKRPLKEHRECLTDSCAKPVARCSCRGMQGNQILCEMSPVWQSQRSVPFKSFQSQWHMKLQELAWCCCGLPLWPPCPSLCDFVFF